VWGNFEITQVCVQQCTLIIDLVLIRMLFLQAVVCIILTKHG